MELACVVLSVVVLVQAVVIAALSATVPWLWWKAMAYEKRQVEVESVLEQMDSHLAEVLKAAGVTPEE